MYTAWIACQCDVCVYYDVSEGDLCSKTVRILQWKVNQGQSGEGGHQASCAGDKSVVVVLPQASLMLATPSPGRGYSLAGVVLVVLE